MRIVVTGATGFIGSHVSVRLAQAGHQVVATGRDPDKVPALGSVPGIVLRRGDLADPSSWTAALEGADVLVHVALGWGDTGPDMLRNDTEASVRLFQAAVDAGVKKIIYTSSTAACGEMAPLNREDMVPRPMDFYGATKAATESYLRAFAHGNGIQAHVVRPGYIFGEPVVALARSQPDRRFARIARAATRGEPIHLVKHDGTQFLHARDIAEVYLALLSCDSRTPTVHYALSSQWRSWAEVAALAGELLGREVDVVLEDKGYGEEPFLFSVDGIRRDFGLDFPNLDRLREHVRWEISRT
ncbi:MAG TPA: NAD(P)-dependent oxidoreductase [Fibrobacteria bacterium]|nr:NAD(P)-dependent oxidoreductase [Fibrobacteria bacterium]HOX50944.1 NAD(P)-dependent oxidoreductase [Fibrobacteria bacterium]